MTGAETDTLDSRNGSPKPRIGITIGDPAGIGPEIVLKAIADRTFLDTADIVLTGSLALLRSTAKRLGISVEFEASGSDRASAEIIAVHDPGGLPEWVEPGSESAGSGMSAARCIEAAVQLWRDGRIDAVATAPISKRALSLAGYAYPGHTEFLADLTGTSQFAMSFFGGPLRVVLLSTHLSLRDAIERVTAENLEKLIVFANRELGKLLNRTVRIAVAGLNPHASEGGMFGGEEHAEINPAVIRCRDAGINVSGPYSPDTIFLRAHRGEFDAVIACYHDQATIAVKCLSFGSAVNVTLGLPLIRTSVDHGTALDIAGKNIADESSMKAAIRTAAELVQIAKSSGDV